MTDSHRELRLGLSGRSLVFPGGAPFCLVCGRRPFGTRTLGFKDTEYAERRTEVANVFLKRVHPLLAWANRARLATCKVDAPLCFRHFWRGRGLEIGVPALFVAAAAAIVILGLKGKLPSSELAGSLLKGLLIAVVLVPGLVLWFRGRRKPVVPCEARREGPDRVVLLYEGDPPRPR